MAPLPIGSDFRVQIRNGERYYSPNSLSDAALIVDEVQPRDSLESNPFKPGDHSGNRVRYWDFVGPRKWSPQFAWISFIPAAPAQLYCDPHSYFGRILYKLPAIDHLKNGMEEVCGFQISRESSWAGLESDLYGAVTTLSRHYHIQCVLPFLPNAIGYRAPFLRKRALEARLQQAREWFFVWFGALSYLVAVVRSPQYPGVKAQMDQQWCSVLQTNGLSPTFIDGMCSSLVLGASGGLQRAGIVLHMAQRASQPSPLWFVDQGVPVWYMWTDREEQLLKQSPELQVLRPPQSLLLPSANPGSRIPPVSPHREPPLSLSAPASIAGRGGLPPFSECAGPMNPESMTPTASRRSSEPEWVTFFRSRESRNASLLKRETLGERQKRESRMREPPTSSAPVFEWFAVGSPGGGRGYERIPVLAKARCETLLQYATSQKRYDPFSNEWDCCDEWGPGDDSGDDEIGTGQDDCGFSTQPLSFTVAKSLVRVERPSVQSAPLSYVDADSPTGVFVVRNEGVPTPPESILRDVDEIFGRFYGFVYSVRPDAATSRPSDAREKAFFIRVLGQHPSVASIEDLAYFQDSSHYQCAQGFLQSLCIRSEPPPGSWDLRDSCVAPVRLSPRLNRIRIVKLRGEPQATHQNYYIFYDKDHSRIKWRLGVASAADALLVCRIPEDSNLHDVALALASYGVSFSTLYPSRTILLPPAMQPRLSHCIPKRPFQYKFTREDYEAYIHMRTLLLGQPHMQAALKRGGIAWRLAVGTLGTSRVTRPPSLWGSVNTVDLQEGSFVDDALTTTELDLLCGAYECVSGKRPLRFPKRFR